MTRVGERGIRTRARVRFPISAGERRQAARTWTDHPGLRHLGARMQVAADVTRAVLAPVAVHHRGGLGTAAVNGGVLAALFDLVLGLPGHLCLGTRTGTVQLSISFMRPVHGDRVVAEGWCERTSARHAFTAARILDEDGRVCARAQGIVARAGGDGPGEPRAIIGPAHGKG